MIDFIHKRLISFSYAWDGLVSLFQNEHNARIHLLATFLVVIFGFVLELEKHEWYWIVLSIAIVFAGELFNSAIENLCDLITAETNPKIKLIKDYSAAGVLVLSVCAAVLGSIIFIPKILNLLNQHQ